VPVSSDNMSMQLQATESNPAPRRTRKAKFLGEMNLVVPWRELVGLLEQAAPAKATGRPPFGHETMLRLHFMQQWFGLSDLGMEEALLDIPLYREFAGLAHSEAVPDRVTILRFRHLLEKHRLCEQILTTVNAGLCEKGLLLQRGTAIDATLIAAPSSTKNQQRERDPEMHQTKKGNQWYFGMKAHIGVDTDSGLVHTVVTTAANAHDITQAHALVHGRECEVVADAGYRGIEKREAIQRMKHQPQWLVAMMYSKRKRLDTTTELGAALEKLEKLKSRIRAKVEHPFRVIKCQFGYTKVKYRGLAKNTANLMTLFALCNLWMARKALLQVVPTAQGAQA
jgi:transposase, IS5 family